jgi:hypothetical protein
MPETSCTATFSAASQGNLPPRARACARECGSRIHVAMVAPPSRSTIRAMGRRHDSKRPGRFRRKAIIAGSVVLLEAVALRIRSGRLGGNVVVRCRQGHLFTTIWIPGGSLKSVRFGWWRFQRCPVGHHWSVVTPVKTVELTEQERRSASETRDIRVP